MKLSNALTVFCALLFSVWMPIAAQALSVSPMSLYIDPTGGGAYQTIIARNTSDQTVALETFVERRSVDANGALKLDQNDEDFLVFPPLATLAPGASQAFRVQWIGELGPNPSAVYYVTVMRLPLSVEAIEEKLGPKAPEEARLMLKLGYAFKVSVGVAPRGSTPNLIAQAIGPGLPARNGKPTVAVQISNEGQGYTQLSNFSYTLTKPGGQTFTTDFDEWGDAAGTALFPSGHSRTVNIPIPDTSWSSGVTVLSKPRR